MRLWKSHKSLQAQREDAAFAAERTAINKTPNYSRFGHIGQDIFTTLQRTWKKARIYKKMFARHYDPESDKKEIQKRYWL
jgi:hypothetical protein